MRGRERECLLLACAATALASLLWGCGPAEEPRYEVHGTVRFQGQPIREGRVTLSNAAQGVHLNANVSPDGQYEVKTYRGKGTSDGRVRRLDPAAGARCPARRRSLAVHPGEIPQPGHQRPEAHGHRGRQSVRRRHEAIILPGVAPALPPRARLLTPFGRTVEVDPRVEGYCRGGFCCWRIAPGMTRFCTSVSSTPNVAS